MEKQLSFVAIHLHYHSKTSYAVISHTYQKVSIPYTHFLKKTKNKQTNKNKPKNPPKSSENPKLATKGRGIGLQQLFFNVH